MRDKHRRRRILVAHYHRVLKRLITWAGVVAVLAASSAAAPALAAGQLAGRSVVLSTPLNSSTAAGQNVTYAFKFTFATSNQTVGSLAMLICDSPLAGSCINAGSSSGSKFDNASSASVSVQSGAWGNAGTCALSATHTGNTAVTDCTVGAITGTPQVTLTINGVWNPSSNGQYYVRLLTWTGQGATGTNTDFGAVAVDTVQLMSELAYVQEDLTFTVGTTGSTCAAVGSSSAAVALNPNIMTSTQTSDGTALLCAGTNAQSGYVITYTGTGFVGPQQTLNNYSSAASTPGADGFGFNLAANSTPSIGVAPSGGSGSCASYPAYCTADQYTNSIAGNVPIANSSAASTGTIYTLSWVANVAASTKPGLYQSSQTFLATGTF